MKALLLLMLALPAHAQMYKWTDANGRVHYSDRPQDGVAAKPLQVENAPAAASPSDDNWREREKISRQNRVRQAQAERRLAAAEQSEKARQQPFNPSMNRSDKPLTDDELCTRDRQQIEFAEKTKNLTVLPLGPRSEAQRQEIIRERKTNHALACAEGRRR
ncbi:DUF4124 domain-containing protein [Duganella sp. FT135W]|uniref:DUF4124 domain-containing protein n=1 Tax=Duganella flavida TaxID=2692175 RepID=A0A6L8KEJ9_9BURK|nr:DUF4124 domain-containing protein [Duganella flavida]MYM25873.1 DUF4124 domain-containing protein [Duganella flavida]